MKLSLRNRFTFAVWAFVFFLQAHAASLPMENNVIQSRDLKKKTKVLIGGAGFAGIAAAEELHKYNVDFMIVEATGSIGGRARCRKIGTGKNKYPLEVGANWISGSAGNPIWTLKKETKLQGFNQWFTTWLYNEAGEKVVGDYEEQWDTKFRKVPRDNHGAEVDFTYWKSVKLSMKCLQLPEGTTLSAKRQKFCDKLCLNLTTGDTFDTLRITNETICNEEGHFVPGNVDMTITDIQRAATGLFPPEADDVCVARLAETYYHDSEIGEEPWKTSARQYFSSETWLEFEPAEWYVLDDRCFSFLPKYQASKFLKTSVKTPRKIKFDDPRLQFNTKVLLVKWDPEGEKEVKVTVCRTEKQKIPNSHDLYPCIDSKIYEIEANEFISTFSSGVLKRSLLEEENSVPLEDSWNVAPRFDPPLSSLPKVVETLKQNDMAHLHAAYFQFKFKFWPNKEFLVTPWTEGNHTCDFAPMWFPLDLRNYHPGSKIMLLYTYGARAVEMAQKSDEQIINELLPVLNKYFGSKIKKNLEMMGITDREVLTTEDVVDFYMTRWSEDALFRGCWATDRLGSTNEQHYNLARRYGSLVFSGENTCRRHAGYTHGAKFAGERSVRELLRDRYGQEDIDTRTLCDFTPKEL